MKPENISMHTPHMIGEEQAHHASVFIPLIEKGGEYHILFQVRSSSLTHQPGDICFPGGRKEGNETPRETALRETCEELLIDVNQIEVLGESDYYLEQGRYIIPIVGKLHNYTYTFSEDEVSEVFTVPLSFFLQTAPKRYEIEHELKFPPDFPFDKIEGGKNYQWHSRKEEILFWEYDHYVIWGMTARLLSGFISILKK